jgi:hypothetical protein
MPRIPQQITRLARRIGIGAIFTARARKGSTHTGVYYGVSEWFEMPDREWHLSAQLEGRMQKLAMNRKPFIVIDHSEIDPGLLLHEIAHHIVVLAGESNRESSPELRAAAQEHLGFVPNTGDYFAACFDETGAEALAQYLCNRPLPSMLHRLAERLLRKAGLADLTGKGKPGTTLELVTTPVLVTAPVAL